MKETLGQRILRLRKERNLTQEELASKVNVTAQAVSKWENEITSPDISILVDLSDIFSITVDELLGKENKTETKVEFVEAVNINELILRIRMKSNDGDKVNINLPMPIIKIAIETGLSLSNFNDNEELKKIDLKQIFELVEKGVIGKLVDIESADGDIVEVVVEKC